MYSSVLRDMTALMDGSEDCVTIEVTESLSTEKEERRRNELEDASSKYKAQAKLLEQARKSCTRPASFPTPEAHAAAMNELDDARLNLQKAASDLEDKHMAAQASLAVWRKKLASLNDLDVVSEHLQRVDSSALRLEIYHGLGFKPILDEEGRPSKILIRAHSGADIYSVAIESEDISYANKLWSLAGSRSAGTP